MIIYRVEHSDTGLGPYHHQHQEDSGLEHGYNDNHPSPLLDFGYDVYRTFMNAGLYLDSRGVLFGFTSMYRLKKWFTDDERSVLKKSGYKIKKYDVDKQDVLISNSKKQCVFIRRVPFEIIITYKHEKS